MKTGSIVLSGIMMYALDSSAYTAIIGYEMPALVYELLDCYRTNCISQAGLLMNHADKINCKRDCVKRLSSDRKPFYVSEKKTSVQEKSPGNQEEINDYKFYIKPVFEFELLDIDLY
jgi:hypothetical protein